MSFITPQLAAPMPKKPLWIRPGFFVAEEKYDGHRLIVEVNGMAVSAWSRDGKSRSLPSHIISSLQNNFPRGIYDGELTVPGGKSHNVTELTQTRNLVYVVFDVLELLGTSTVFASWTLRREYLKEIFKQDFIQDAVKLSAAIEVPDMAFVTKLMAQMLKEGREGLILKRVASRYSPGKRPSEDWIKMKGLKSEVLTVIGFQASKGTVMGRGKYAIVELRDDHGIETTVKTLNDKEIEKFERDAGEGKHPAIGARLRIEYQEKTADGFYRHPRWDRWEDE